jgi:phosphoribosylaminoimidazole-succinocarboxamide synthase
MVPKYAPAVTDLTLIHQGKVRDTFEVPDRNDLLFVVATDRISTHNIVHESIIPGKGCILTQLIIFWMTGPLKEHCIDTHLVAYGDEIFKYVPIGIAKNSRDLTQRALIVKKLTMLPFEFIYRDRMAGSMWKSYQKGEPNPYGLTLPEGMRLMERFPETIFTPTEKSEHDNPVSSARVIKYHKHENRNAHQAYNVIRGHALKCGIDLIDGKFEVGFDDNFNVCIADECGTPDCSRFVNTNSIVVGNEPAWLDKQFVREEAERTWGTGKKYPIKFSSDVIEKTVDIYYDIFMRITR